MLSRKYELGDGESLKQTFVSEGAAGAAKTLNPDLLSTESGCLEKGWREADEGKGLNGEDQRGRRAGEEERSGGENVESGGTSASGSVGEAGKMMPASSAKKQIRALWRLEILFQCEKKV